MLMRQSLVDSQTKRGTERPVIRILPWLNVIKNGARSIVDSGRDAGMPVDDELAQALTEHRLLIATGAGIRSRHIFSVGLDLGLPTGVLAALSAADAEQNAHIIATLMAQHGVVFLPHMMVAHQLATFLNSCHAVVMNGVPPYDLWEFPPEEGKIPEHRTDAGAFLLAESYGARRLIYVEDVDGIYTADPKTHPEAELIPRISVDELEALALETLPLDRLVLSLMRTARHQREIQIVNGRKPGSILRALRGEHVGTIVYAGDRQPTT
jgi:molybdenum storage protein